MALRLDPDGSPAPTSEPVVGGLTRPSFADLADTMLLAACALVIGFCLLQIALFDYGRDQGIYAMVGRSITQGGMPYRDAWDFKTPGIFLVYALSRVLFGASQRGIRLLEVLSLLAMIGAMTRLSRDEWGDRRIGFVGGAIAVLIHAQLDFWHTAQPESFGGVLTIFALYFGLRAPADDTAPSRRDLARWAFAGALLGFAGLLKPPLAGGALPLAVYHLARARRGTGKVSRGHHGDTETRSREKRNLNSSSVSLCLRGESSSLHADAAEGSESSHGGTEARSVNWRPVIALAAGGAAPILLCVLWFAARGALGDLREVLFVFTPHYTALSWVGETVAGMVYWGFTEWLQQYCSVATVGVLLLLAMQPARRARPSVYVVAGILGIHLLGVSLQGKFFPYHYGATWPLTALLAGHGYVRLFDHCVRRGPGWAVLFAVSVLATAFGRTATKDTPDSFLDRCRKRVTLLAKRPNDVAGWDKLASVADVNAGANRAVAAFVRERVPAERTLLVWGFEPVIYDLADRRPATRFLYDVPQRVEWAKAALRDVMMRDLAAAPPAAIVVERRDVFPMVTGSTLDSADSLPDFPALQGLIASRYRRETTIEDFDVYLERPQPAGR